MARMSPTRIAGDAPGWQVSGCLRMVASSSLWAGRKKILFGSRKGFAGSLGGGSGKNPCSSECWNVRRNSGRGSIPYHTDATFEGCVSDNRHGNVPDDACDWRLLMEMSKKFLECKSHLQGCVYECRKVGKPWMIIW